MSQVVVRRGSYPLVSAMRITGGGSGSGPATAGTLSVNATEVVGAFTVPADKLYVRIQNNGFAQDGDTETDITVNGQTISPGNFIEFHAKLDSVTNIFKRTPEISGNTNGARAIIQYTS